MKKLIFFLFIFISYFLSSPSSTFAACIDGSSCSGQYSHPCEYYGDRYCCEAAGECRPGPLPTYLPPAENRGISNPALPPSLGEHNTSDAVSRYLSTIVSTLIVLGGLLAFFYLLYGAIEWLMSGGDQEKIKQAQRKITYAIAGLFILTAIFAIANLIGGILGIDLLNINLSKLAPDA